MCEIKDLFVFAILILCTISDIRRKGVYTWVLIVLTLLLVIFSVCFQTENIWSTVGGLIVGILFFIVSKLSREAIGYADSWMILLLGGYLGLKNILIMLTLAFVITGIVGLVGFVFRKLKKTSSVPFIPFLTIAYIGVMLL